MKTMFLGGLKRALTIVVVLTMSACAVLPPSYNVAKPDEDTLERAKTDSGLDNFLQKLQKDVFIVTTTSPAQNTNDVTLKTQAVVPKDFKSAEDFRPLGSAQAESFNGKLATTALGAGIGAVGVVGGAIALGKTMPGNEVNTTNCNKGNGTNATTTFNTGC